jgi:two-component system, NtrC family, sensor histidine kinase HydH
MWKRVVAPAIVVSVLWIAGFVISSYYFHRFYESYSRVLDDDVATIRAAWAMQDALWRLHIIVGESNHKNYRETRMQAAELESAFERYLTEAERTSLTPDEKACAKAVRERLAVYRDHIETLFPLLRTASSPASRMAEESKRARLAYAVAEPCRQLVDLNERALADSMAQTKRLSTCVNVVRFAFLIMGPIVGLVLGWWIARRLNRSISQISVTLSGATGDLNQEVASVEIRNLDDLSGLQQQVQVVATRIRQVLEELQQARRQAMLAERLAAVGELAAGVAHEIRNPLTAVKLLVQTAVQRPSSTPLPGQQLQVALQEIARMENTIQSLLDYARPPGLHRVAHDLRVTLRRAMNLVEGRAKQQNVTIAENVPDAPVIVDGDPEQLHQILINLFLNGIEAMPQGGSLTVAMEADETVRHVCRTSVADSGQGIQPLILDRIFEPFVTSKERGTGLGLAISYRIAKEHSGVLLAANRRDGGAVLTLELPLTRKENNGKAASD